MLMSHSVLLMCCAESNLCCAESNLCCAESNLCFKGCVPISVVCKGYLSARHAYIAF